MDNSAQLSLRTESTVNSATILPLNCLYFVAFFFWQQDIDTIYLSLNTKELNIQDFDHLDQK